MRRGVCLPVMTAQTPPPNPLAPDLDRALAASRWLGHWLQRAEAPWRQHFEQALNQPHDPARAARWLDEALADAAGEPGQMQALRRARNLGQAVIAARALGGAAELDETLLATSDLAELCVCRALALASATLHERFGTPRDANGRPVQPVVIAMGKLGGRELNFSSDVDLMLFYTAGGESDGARSIANETWFAKLVQQFSRLLAEQTVDGFVYRLDWALRPFGHSGPPAMHLAAAEHYYQAHGREWERYALIKARPIAGDLEAGAHLLAQLRPFVYRRYLDYSAIESLRDLKTRIEEDVARRNQEENIKLGRGGIREIEFIAQAFQLVRGGQEPRLRDVSLRSTLRSLSELGSLPPATARNLDQHYEFLRRLENALQMYADAQTHVLPSDPAARQALCVAMDEPDWAALLARLEATRFAVEIEFRRIFAARRRREASPLSAALRSFWRHDEDADSEGRQRLVDALGEAGFEQVEAVVESVQAVRDNPLARRLAATWQQRVGELVGRILEAALAQPAPARAARRALEVIEHLAGRTPYVSLLLEGETARTQLLRLCASSPWITQLLARQPMLLDQLLDARTLYQPPDREEMQAELSRRLRETPAGDVEARMNALRRFRQEVTLRVAAADCVEALPLPKVSDRLTWLAEVILDATLQAVWQEMAGEYGEPCRSDGQRAGFAIIGYGKLGGIEMGYGSDLDVVFLHDCDAADGETQGGARSISAGVWYARFAQRLVHWLSTQTAAGRAYEVDLQLRPSGNAGLLVSSLASFERYQREQAWTWEHQALTRARFICGDAEIGARFESLRRQILALPRDAAGLAAEIREMREKMRSHMEKRQPGRWDIKQGVGGLTDLEFAVQYLVLAHVGAHPALADWPDQWRQTEALVEAGLLEADEAQAMIAAYRRLRAALHALALEQVDGLADEDAFATERQVVSAIYARVFGSVECRVKESTGI